MFIVKLEMSLICLGLFFIFKELEELGKDTECLQEPFFIQEKENSTKPPHRVKFPVRWLYVPLVHRVHISFLLANQQQTSALLRSFT